MQPDLGHCCCTKLKFDNGLTVSCHSTPTEEDLLCDFCRSGKCGVLLNEDGDKISPGHAMMDMPYTSKCEWAKTEDTDWVKDAVDKPFPRKYLDETVMGIPIRIDPNLPPPGWEIES